MLRWLLLFVPVTVAAHYVWHVSETLVFFGACLAIVPLAGWLGTSTEHLAERAGPSMGGLLNATFGNAAELIIAVFALQNGLGDVVKASLTGSVLGNLLLVLGGSALAGGLKYKVQRFNAKGARIRGTSLALAAIALVLPASYHHLAGAYAQRNERGLSVEISAVLLVTYAAVLLFSLHTHRQFFQPEDPPPAKHDEPQQSWSIAKSVAVLAASTALVGWMSEILVGSVEHAARALGMTSIFVGVIVVGIVGNAAEHSTALMVARKNQMDLAVSIAIGSSIQIALFVAPVLVLLSYVIGPAPIDLVFTPAEVLAIVLAVWIANEIAGDGQSNWLEGVQLLAVYCVLAFVFYYLPEARPAPPGAANP